MGPGSSEPETSGPRSWKRCVNYELGQQGPYNSLLFRVPMGPNLLILFFSHLWMGTPYFQGNLGEGEMSLFHLASSDSKNFMELIKKKQDYTPENKTDGWFT